MESEQEVVFGRREAEQVSAQERRTREVEGGASVGVGKGGGMREASVRREVREVGEREEEVDGGRDELKRRAIGVREGGAERFVAADDFREGAAERIHVQLARKANGGWDVISAAAGRQLVKEPEALLREGEREALRAVRVMDDLLLCAALFLAEAPHEKLKLLA
jgi:hypothetical protein